MKLFEIQYLLTRTTVKMCALKLRFYKIGGHMSIPKPLKWVTKPAVIQWSILKMGISGSFVQQNHEKITPKLHLQIGKVDS